MQTPDEDLRNSNDAVTDDSVQMDRYPGEFSAAQKAYTQFLHGVTVQSNAEVLQLEEARRNARQQEELFHMRQMAQATQNLILNVAALNAVTNDQISLSDLVQSMGQQQTGSQVSLNDLIAAIGQQMSKSASNTPPQTGTSSGTSGA